MSGVNLAHLPEIIQSIGGSSGPVRVLWPEQDMLVFVARGREHRSEFHIDPSDEIMHMLKGQMDLHYLTPAGEHKIAVMHEGDILHCPAGTPHSPRFSPDAYLLVIERHRRPGELDRFLWFCERCEATLFEATRQVADYRQDPVSSVYQEFYSSAAHRTCRTCGYVAPAR
jgi:3-hydroxyanthranilate 3,4-dioxygenase